MHPATSYLDTLNEEQRKTLELLTAWTGTVYRIHTSIYDTTGSLVVCDCEDGAIEHVAVALDIQGDQAYFDEIVKDYIADGLSEDEAWCRASEGFYWINGAEPLNIEDWTVRPASAADRKRVQHIIHLDRLIGACDCEDDIEKLVETLKLELDRILAAA